MNKKILDDIIQNFDTNKFRNFFRSKNRNFSPREEDLSQYDTDIFSFCHKNGELNFENQNMLFIHIKTENELTERSSKKKQYELAKKILKELSFDSGIFIFYDENGNFRFSLVYTNYISKRRDWSNFRRFTYYVNKNLTNKTFLYRIGDLSFDTFENIKEAFSVDKVTKEFYKDIANWYFWAVDNSRFPKDAEETDMKNGRNIAVIRLITRLIFIWFMKEMKLIPVDLFDKEKIRNILKNISDDESGYYKAILQNLFFATLSTPIEEREFATEKRNKKGFNSDFGNQNVFRYQDEFINPDSIKLYFNSIPFLNGGLFECLDNKNEGIYIDGFSRTLKNQPIIPNKLFFKIEENADLNKWYNTINKNYKVKGLIEILSSYNFTVDENSADDADIALDPELLGKVFENLLASFNPETSTTARKATGSFYTPREIVDYMINESLKEYFKTNLPEDKNIEEKLDNLFDLTKTDNPFDNINTKKFVNLIENVKIVDPAVGSGAFPMGILNKLVFILNKIDSDNILWKEAQIKSIANTPDSRLRDEMKAHIEKYFYEKNPDYGRKLYLIQKCIYGVDIQQIAVEIAKLRFFISLLIDEKIEKSKPNWNIEPLPNLDFKIMQGNSLISSFMGIDLELSEDKRKNFFRTNRNIEEIFEKYLELKEEYQTEFNNIRKKLLKNSIEETLFKLFDIVLKRKISIIKSFDSESLFKLNSKQKSNSKTGYSKLAGYNLETIENEYLDYTKKTKAKPFFLWTLYFNEVFQEKEGFDIVIGNPPYIQLQKEGGKLANLYKNSSFQTFDRTGDIYTLFYEKGINLLTEKGHLCYITSNKWMRAGYGEKLRDFFLRYNPKILIDLGPGVFENATVDTNIILIQKDENNKELKGITLNTEAKNKNLDEFVCRNSVNLQNINKNAWYIGNSSEQRLKEKIENIGKPLRDWDINIYYGIKTGLNEAYIIDTNTKERLCREDPKNSEIIKPILRGRDIKRYYYDWTGLWIIFIPWHFPLHRDESIQGASIEAEKEFKNSYSIIYNHLLKFRQKLERRNKDETGIRYEWYSMQRCANTYYSEFEKLKVVWGNIAYENTFAYVDNGIIVNAPANLLTSSRDNIKYLTAIMNSKIFNWEFKQIGIFLGHAFEWKKQYVEQIHIPVIKEDNLYIKSQIDKLVEEIIRRKSVRQKTVDLENQIELLIYKLYDLTSDEIKIIDN